MQQPGTQSCGPGVGEGGFEPPHAFAHWLLKPACLPFHHSPKRMRPTRGPGYERG